MHSKIKNKIEKSLTDYIQYSDKTYSLKQTSPLLFKSLKDFVLSKGKRVRPTLFVIGYLGFAKKPAVNLYRAAISTELLHDFMLIHDDIIDKSDRRRGKPSMHKTFDHYLKPVGKSKFSGQDLAIIAGDVLYALAIDAFLSIEENMQRKQRALKEFIQAAIYTATGEFIELLSSLKSISKITKQDIYRIYDYKTAYYTFASPLSCGAMLAGARKDQVNRLHKYGIYLGRAFQIKDDLLAIFGDEKKVGKSTLTDLQEAKRTLLVWYAYGNCSQKNKLIIKRILSKTKVNQNDLLAMRKIIIASGALDYAQNEIAVLGKKAQGTIKSSRIRLKYKTYLHNYIQELLKL